MRRVLALVTRMYAERDSDRDEFVEDWLTTDKNDEFILFSETTLKERWVLVVHGYDYPRVANEDAISRASHDITQGLAVGTLRGFPLELGILFHPPMTWGPTAKDFFVTGLLNCLNSVHFVREYRHGSEIVRQLAIKCRSNEDFSADFDRTWHTYGSDYSRYDSRLGSFMHDTENNIAPLLNDLEEWRRRNFDQSFGQNILEHYRNSNGSLLAIQRSLNNRNTLEIITKIVNDLVLETQSPRKLSILDEQLSAIADFLRTSDASCSAVSTQIEELGKDGIDQDRALANLREITEETSLRQWYERLNYLLISLRRELTKADI